MDNDKEASESKRALASYQAVYIAAPPTKPIVVESKPRRLYASSSGPTRERGDKSPLPKAISSAGRG